MTVDPIAVVVPTHRGGHRLPGLVAALEAQEGAPPFEVVIVDDGSPDDTFDVLEKVAASATIPVRPIRLDRNRGAAGARNVGWRSTDAPVVAFTDDDCVPEPGWLAALSRRLTDHGGGIGIVQGYTTPIDEQLVHQGPFSHSIWCWEEKGFYETCNIAYRRDVLDRMGGFDESFRDGATGRPLFGEDMDLAWRSKESGVATAFEPEAVVRHEMTPSDWRARLRDSRRRAGMVRVIAKHPQLRNRFHQRVFYKPTHAPALLALAGLVGCAAAAARRRPASFAAASLLGAPYLWTRTRGAEPLWCRRRDWPTAIPQAFVIDLLDIAVMARASVRERAFFV